VKLTEFVISEDDRGFPRWIISTCKLQCCFNQSFQNCCV